MLTDMRKILKDMRRKKIAAVETAIDIRKVEIQYEPDVAEEHDPEDNYYSSSQKIVAKYDGKEIGHIDFSYVEQENEEGEQEKLLYLAYIEVDDDFKGLGISGLLYKKFGEIYSQKYNNLPVERHFENPLAEYSFKRAIEKGWVPESALTEERITRQYDTEDKKHLWNDLREKLPEYLRGPKANLFNKMKKVFSTIKNAFDFRKLDLRREASQQEKSKNNVIRKDLRKLANNSNVTISPIEVITKQISNRAHKIEVRRDGELLGDMKYEVYPEEKVLYINYIEIQEPYRKQGLAMLIYRTLSEIYNSQYQGWRISRVFVNPVAEYVFNKAVAEGLFPDETLNNIRRDYTPEQEEQWYNEFLPRIMDLRKKKKQSV